jgi:hypothetical protein
LIISHILSIELSWTLVDSSNNYLKCHRQCDEPENSIFTVFTKGLSLIL